MLSWRGEPACPQPTRARRPGLPTLLLVSLIEIGGFKHTFNQKKKNYTGDYRNKDKEKTTC